MNGSIRASILTVTTVNKTRSASGVLAISSSVTQGGTPRTDRRISATLGLTSQVLRAPLAAAPGLILHALADFYTAPSGSPLTTRLVVGMDGCKVPWGILQEITEVEDCDVKTWTATDGEYLGQVVGVSLENARTTASLSAIFLKGNNPPARGEEFTYRKSTGPVTMIALKVTRLWASGSFQSVQIEATRWDGALARIS